MYLKVYESYINTNSNNVDIKLAIRDAATLLLRVTILDLRVVKNPEEIFVTKRIIQFLNKINKINQQLEKLVIGSTSSNRRLTGDTNYQEAVRASVISLQLQRVDLTHIDFFTYSNLAELECNLDFADLTRASAGVFHESVSVYGAILDKMNIANYDTEQLEAVFSCEDIILNDNGCEVHGKIASKLLAWRMDFKSLESTVLVQAQRIEELEMLLRQKENSASSERQLEEDSFDKTGKEEEESLNTKQQRLTEIYSGVLFGVNIPATSTSTSTSTNNTPLPPPKWKPV